MWNFEKEILKTFEKFCFLLVPRRKLHFKKSNFYVSEICTWISIPLKMIIYHIHTHRKKNGYHLKIGLKWRPRVMIPWPSPPPLLLQSHLPLAASNAISRKNWKSKKKIIHNNNVSRKIFTTRIWILTNGLPWPKTALDFYWRFPLLTIVNCDASKQGILQ